ncbi:MAG: calcium-binding EGF-like domain-containing protein [Deltaproteobacteria bacterium]|nr:calcium-binding EGF-like domain-containing protein [Deltaproteobacteria bacterium]
MSRSIIDSAKRMTRTVEILVVLIFLVAGAMPSCGDLHTSVDQEEYQNHEEPKPEDQWRPKEKPSNDCSYGYGEECPEPAVDCGKAPCIHGICVDGEKGAEDYCLCDTGYAGLLCDTCAKGFKPKDLECVPDSPCAGGPCVFGTCREKDNGFWCDCYTGYTGRLCDTCADGYHSAGMQCVPD